MSRLASLVVPAGLVGCVAGCVLFWQAACCQADETMTASQLVQQLGDEDYQVRERATEELTRRGGQETVAALEQGADAFDREIRYRSRRILSILRAQQREMMLEQFLSEAGVDRDYGLPGWQRFRQRVGDSAASRSLFVEMQRAEPELLHAMELDRKRSASTLEARAQQAQNASRYGQQPPLGTVAAMLFAASDADVPASRTSYALLHTLLHQPVFRSAMSSGVNKPLLKKLLGAWVLRSDASYSYQSLALAMQYELKEGVQAALQALEEPTQAAHVKNFAVLTIAKMGDASHLGVLEQLFNDRSPCSTRRVQNRTYQAQVRDVALAASIYLSGQQLIDFGFESEAQPNSQLVLNVASLGFESDEERAKCFDKWHEYLKAKKNDARAEKKRAPPVEDPRATAGK